MRVSNLGSALIIAVILAVSSQAQYFTLPGSFSYAQGSTRQVMDISPDGKIGIALRNDPVSAHAALLTTFDPILGAQMDSKTFGFGPLGVQLAQVGNELRAVVLTSQGGPRRIYLFNVSANGQLTEITSKELTTSNSDGGSNIVLSGVSQTGFVVVYPAAGLGGELVAFSLVDGSIVSRLPIDGIAGTLVMSERPTSRLLACRTFDTFQIVDSTNPAQPIKLTPVPLPRNADFNAIAEDGIAFSSDARYVFVGNSLYDFAAIDVAALQVISTIGGSHRFAGVKVFEDGQKRWLAIQGITTGTAGINSILLVDATDPFHLSMINQYNFGTEPFSYLSDFAFSSDGTKLFVVATQKLIAFDLPGFSKAWEQPVPLSVLTEHQAIVHSQPDEVLGAWQVFDGLRFTSMLGAFPIVPPKISVSGLTTVEGNSGTPAANFTVTLEVATKHRLTVRYATSDGSALKGLDYAETSGTLTFEPGEIVKAASVPIVADALDEFDESFTLNLSNPNLGVIVTGQATCVISDDDLPPSASIGDVSLQEGNSATPATNLTVTLSAVSGKQISFQYATVNGSATANDYVSKSGTIAISPGNISANFTVEVHGDVTFEADETFGVVLSMPTNAELADGQSQVTILNDDPQPTVTIETISISEGQSAVNVLVRLSNASGQPTTVNYATSDTAGLNNCNVTNGVASSRCDYATSVGTLRFAAGETSKTISIPVVNDSYAEGNENFTVTLSNPTGAVLGTTTTAVVTINDNDFSTGPNPIDQTPFFVRQQYVDFLGREPDPPGFAAWQAIINNCSPNDTTCDRIHVSSAFFRSPEFQERGYFVYRFYPVAFGRKPDYVEFIPDLAKVSGFLSDAELEAARVAFIAEFMSRPAFVTKFNGLNNTQYVDLLLSTAGVTHANRDAWIAALGAGTKTRAQVLREIVESTEVYNKYYNQAFVVMQYFGYLRRDPDALYLDWIQVLDTTGNFRTMVNGFMNSTEYRLRFGP